MSHILSLFSTGSKDLSLSFKFCFGSLLLWTYPGKFVWEAIQNYHFHYWWYKRNLHHFEACFVKLLFQLQSVTKIVKLAPLAPIFNVDFKFPCLFLATIDSNSFSRLGQTLNRGGGGILDVLEKVKHILTTFSWKYRESQ